MSGAKRTTCSHVGDNGPCGMTTTLSPDTKLCIWHDPHRRDEARRRQVAGGKATAEKKKRGGRPNSETRVVAPEDAPSPLESLDDCVKWASWLATATATGAIDGKTAREVAGAIREFRSSYEKAHLAGRVKELEQALRQAKKDQGR